jgi:hypothetical protein
VRATRARPVAWCRVAPALVACGLLALPGAAGASRPSPPLATVVIPDLGPGYSVSSEGPLDASRFASNSPDPAAASTALATLAKTISTYERVWSDAGGANEVQDLLVRFPAAVGAQVFLRAAQHSLDSGEIVSSGPLPGVPGAHRTTYFAATTQAGVGQAITLRAGVYVTLLSFFSAASGNARPITQADAVRIARAQQAAMVSASGGTAALAPTSPHKGVSPGSIAAAVLVVAVLGVAVVTPALLRRRRQKPLGLDATR